VYLASLELGQASVSDISKKAGLKRPTVYLTIDELLQKQLIYKVAKGKKNLYHAEKPDKIVSDLKSKLEQLENLLPELENIYQHPLPKPRIRFYEGKHGLKQIYQEIASSSAQVFTCVSIEKLNQVFNQQEIKQLFKTARECETKFKDLLEPSAQAKKYAKAEYRQKIGPIKFLPKDFKLSTDTLIYGSKTAMISFNDLVAVVIENQPIAQTQKMFLESLRKHL
jgi:sugar-specific transcriptional regulator TrmB